MVTQTPMQNSMAQWMEEFLEKHWAIVIPCVIVGFAYTGWMEYKNGESRFTYMWKLVFASFFITYYVIRLILSIIK